MLHLLNSIERDRQMIETEMLSIAAQIKTLQERYKRLDRDRENLIHAINQLEDALNG